MSKKYIYILFLLIFTQINLHSQVTESVINKFVINNYVITRTYTDNTSNRYIDEIQYFDGLGRKTQTVLVRITPKRNNLVSNQEYNILGLESETWQPISFNRFSFSVKDLKNSSYSQNRDIAPYTKPSYEASPLNRVQEQYGPGEDWHNNSKAVKANYLANVSGDPNLNSKLYTVAGTTSNPSLNAPSNYPSGELYVNRAEDENGSVSYEFKDKLDQVVLTRQINNGANYDTYYVYDDYGNLCYVLPPRIQDEGIEQTKLDTLAYQYRYDYRNRCVWKKLPGCEPIFYVYDKADQLIFTQDGEQREKKEWLFSIPDVFGRPVLSGVCRDTISISNRVVKAEYAANGSGQYNGYQIKIDNNPINFNQVTKILSVNYYDNYDFLGRNNFPNQSYDQLKEADEYGKRYDEGNGYEAKGQLTGSITALFEKDTNKNQFLYSTMYYDNRARLIQSHSTNHLGGTETEYLAYNFTGQPIKTLHIHRGKSSAETTEQYVYTYDHAGRLIETQHKINNLPWMTLSKNSYDELGRLDNKIIGGNKVANTNP